MSTLWSDKPTVKLIADTVWKDCPRISTFELKYWRPLLPEMNTHRVFSRNAASSRAQSFEKRCNAVFEQPKVPAHWNQEQKGMVGGEEFSDDVKDFINQSIRNLAQETVIRLDQLNKQVKLMSGHEIHKQYLNRYLEPFTEVTQLVTSVEWDNFFKLRLAPDAQPEMQDIARQMKKLLDSHKPRESEIHLPYIMDGDRIRFPLDLEKLAVARCARVSYRAYDGRYQIEKDLALYDRLLKAGHMSPFEHVAFASEPEGHFYNLVGWKSLRYELEHDNADLRSEGGRN